MIWLIININLYNSKILIIWLIININLFSLVSSLSRREQSTFYYLPKVPQLVFINHAISSVGQKDLSTRDSLLIVPASFWLSLPKIAFDTACYCSWPRIWSVDAHDGIVGSNGPTIHSSDHTMVLNDEEPTSSWQIFLSIRKKILLIYHQHNMTLIHMWEVNRNKAWSSQTRYRYKY